MLQSFGNFAIKLARNPLGILALLVVLVYGIAGYAASSSAFQPGERIILVWFMVLFPLIVLFTLYQLVTKHHDKLYAPSDFTNEDNFVRLLEGRIEASPKLQAIEKMAKQVQEEFTPLVLKASDDDESDQNALAIGNVSPKLDEEKILKLLRDGKYTYRSVGGINKELEIENKQKTRNILFELKENKLIGERDRGKGLRYFITDNGRKVLKEKGI